MAPSTSFLFCLQLFSIISISTGNRIFDVVIIGAGPAGIAAAIDLGKASSSISMTILEARNRVGGRVSTDTHTFTGDVSVDIGAEWIHAYGPNNPLYSLHRQLQTNEDKRGDDYFDFFEPEVTGCYDTTSSIVSSQICLGAQQTMNKLFSPKYNATLKLRDVSVWDMIRSEYEKIPEGQLKRLVDAMLIGKEEYEAADLNRISARQHFFGDSPGDDEEERGEDMALKRGYGSLIQRIVERFALPIQLNTQVTRIVTSASNRAQILTKNGETIQAKYILITVPLGCLKQETISFEPSLPQWKQNVIDAMGFGDTDKIILQFDKTFWDSKLTTFYIAGASYPFTVSAPKKRILEFMIGGTRARRMEASKDENTIATILNDLKRAFPNQNFKLERYRISRWTADPYARGSYSYYAFNTSLETFETLARECCYNQLFWAGEHTSSGGSVHTAFATGQREAKKILQRFENKLNY
ncbi:unnamed protein product [Rotaria magnacalcarata]|uniref:Amine oxidase domain-containing protein n=3 Tax=Rotaria magnacalcarata TaxID=392030 RepID=A0A820KTP0_9BILA|nr:unnamed protein product [Rotaria magnacalcarata]CAF4347179.1 unnamed protein product [Rotaria magnacalcarata]